MTTPAIDSKTVNTIATLIEARPDFQDTLCLRQGDEDWLHAYHAFAEGTRLVILSEYDDGTEYSRQFLVYDVMAGTLREATPDEDDKYREQDDNNPLMENDDMEIIIYRDSYNRIIKGGTPDAQHTEVAK